MFKNQIGGFKDEFGSKMAVLNEVKNINNNTSVSDDYEINYVLPDIDPQD